MGTEEKIEMIETEEQEKKELEAAKLILRSPLPDNPTSLIGAMKIIEAHYARLGTLLSKADAMLDYAEKEALVSKDCMTVKMTAYEKEVFVKARVREERQFRDEVKYMLDTIKQRINLGQSVLAFMRDFKIGV